MFSTFLRTSNLIVVTSLKMQSFLASHSVDARTISNLCNEATETFAISTLTILCHILLILHLDDLVPQSRKISIRQSVKSPVSIRYVCCYFWLDGRILEYTFAFASSGRIDAISVWNEETSGWYIVLPTSGEELSRPARKSASRLPSRQIWVTLCQ